MWEGEGGCRSSVGVCACVYGWVGVEGGREGERGDVLRASLFIVLRVPLRTEMKRRKEEEKNIYKLNYRLSCLR